MACEAYHVGFAIDAASLQAEFAAWAELGGGAYFSAGDAAELADALTQAVATGFTVTNAAGDVVAEGRPGEFITLPAGDYAVEWGEDQSVATTVPPGDSITVTLD